jgi:3-deoxy-manno-octulosonate cytidylyltransferase (CMP-KDO synthetase)
MKRTVAIIIPARFKSTRFPGKPLAIINGREMILRVADNASKVVSKNQIYIATDNDQIRDVVEESGYNAIMTSEHCLTGTDRVAEASLKIPQSIIINLQGDEPLIKPEAIEEVIKVKKNHINSVINTKSSLSDEERPDDRSIIKVVTTAEDFLLYASRNPIPGTKKGTSSKLYKQGGIYAFTKEQLALYSTLEQKTPLEQEEDIEVLRFLELGIAVKMVEIDQETIAVDYPDDIERVENKLNQE